MENPNKKTDGRRRVKQISTYEINQKETATYVHKVSPSSPLTYNRVAPKFKNKWVTP